MKNSEVQIVIETKGTRRVICKRGAQWVMTTQDGKAFEMTAEQLLSHVLPVLAGIQPQARITVSKRRLGSNLEAVQDLHTIDAG
jgi:hypothetical protein